MPDFGKFKRLPPFEQCITSLFFLDRFAGFIVLRQCAVFDRSKVRYKTSSDDMGNMGSEQKHIFLTFKY
jgi:hypothetical protein